MRRALEKCLVMETKLINLRSLGQSKDRARRWAVACPAAKARKEASMQMLSVCRSKLRNSSMQTSLIRPSRCLRRRSASMSMTMLFCTSSVALQMSVLGTYWPENRCLPSVSCLIELSAPSLLSSSAWAYHKRFPGSKILTSSHY